MGFLHRADLKAPASTQAIQLNMRAGDAFAVFVDRDRLPQKGLAPPLALQLLEIRAHQRDSDASGHGGGAGRCATARIAGDGADHHAYRNRSGNVHADTRRDIVEGRLGGSEGGAMNGTGVIGSIQHDWTTALRCLAGR
jgi:hypothetical protein